MFFKLEKVLSLGRDLNSLHSRHTTRTRSRTLFVNIILRREGIFTQNFFFDAISKLKGEEKIKGEVEKQNACGSGGAWRATKGSLWLLVFFFLNPKQRRRRRKKRNWERRRRRGEKCLEKTYRRRVDRWPHWKIIHTTQRPLPSTLPRAVFKSFPDA